MRGGKRAGERRIRVTVDEHQIGRVRSRIGPERHEHAAGHVRVGAAGDAQAEGRRRDVEFAEEHVGHRRVGMLAGVDDEFGQAARGQRRLTGAALTNWGGRRARWL